MRVSHDSRETFVRASHDCTTVVRVRHSRDCLTTVARYLCERLTTVVRHLRECFTTFVRILISFIYRNSVSKWSYLCRIVQIAETSLRCVCERLRRVGDRFATYAMTWRRFCNIFCRTKKYYMFKTLATRSRRVRDACEDFAIPCERFATVRDGLANRFALVTSQ